MSKRRYPLSIHITSLFLVLTLVVGVALITISYTHSQALLTQSAKGLSREHSQKLESAFRQSVGPILTTLDMMAVSSFLEDYREQDTLRPWLSSIALIFEQNPNLVALYHGSEQGKFVQYRLLSSHQMRTIFEAPGNAYFLINTTQVDGSNEFIFLDNEFNPLSTRYTQDNQFDPRVRPWYVNAELDGQIRLTEPYFFYFLETNGVTLSRRSPSGMHVVGADYTLQSLSNQISELAHGRNTKLALFDEQTRLIADHGLMRNETLSPLEQIRASVFSDLVNKPRSQHTDFQIKDFNETEWSVTLTPVSLTDKVTLTLAEATPADEIMADLVSMRDKQITVAVVLLVLGFTIVWFVANRLSHPLQHLVDMTDNIARFSFKKTRYPRSMIKEVSNLTQSIELMEHTLHDLLRLLRETASNQDFNLLAKTISHQAYLVTKAETIMLFIDRNQDEHFDIAANHAIIPFKLDVNQFVQETPWLLSQLKSGEVVHLDRSANSLKRHQDTIFNSDLYLFPLLNRHKELVGILLIGYERAITSTQQDKHPFLKELLSFAEIAKDNIDKMQQQKDMLNAFVELIASAIDTKSPYTGGHCQRVPTIAKWLAEAANDDKHFFPDFSMSGNDWESLNLAAWLHDCGKVTTPEFVVDKATKLETIYDRIHEVRMRFEVLKLQAEVEYWQGMSQGQDQAELTKRLTETHATLDEEFAFVAQCNIGSESMQPQDITRLEQIAQRQWKRTLDKTLGISWIEKDRHPASEAALPIMEPLLSDRPEHQIPWHNENPAKGWQQAFILQPTEYKYHRGELHNLKIEYGTLSPEERFVINDHIIQTHTMLNHLPYPDYLKSVPDIASHHHERMDGKGYPLGLAEEELSIPARIMAIADVFEALTSSDRPYKRGKTLSEALNIMTTMATSGHIDPKLYLIFLVKQVDQTYANAFIADNQRDDIDRDAHIRSVKAHLRQQF